MMTKMMLMVMKLATRDSLVTTVIILILHGKVLLRALLSCQMVLMKKIEIFFKNVTKYFYLSPTRLKQIKKNWMNLISWTKRITKYREKFMNHLLHPETVIIINIIKEDHNNQISVNLNLLVTIKVKFQVRIH